MSDPNHTHTNSTLRETHVEKSRSGGSMAFIVGGLVVAVAIIAWLFFAGSDGVDTTAGGGATDTGSGDVNVSVESGADAGASGAADGGGEAADTGGDAAATGEAGGSDAAAGADAEATTGN